MPVSVTRNSDQLYWLILVVWVLLLLPRKVQHLASFDLLKIKDTDFGGSIKLVLAKRASENLFQNFLFFTYLKRCTSSLVLCKIHLRV